MARIAILSTDVTEKLPLYIAAMISQREFNFDFALYVHETIRPEESQIPLDLLPEDRRWFSDVAPRVPRGEEPSIEHELWEYSLLQRILAANVRYVVCDLWINGGLFFSLCLRRAFKAANIQVVTDWPGSIQHFHRHGILPEHVWGLYLNGELPNNKWCVTCFNCHLAEEVGRYNVLAKSTAVRTKSIDLSHFEKSPYGEALYLRTLTQFSLEVVCEGLQRMDDESAIVDCLQLLRIGS
jgi:hypothetical protein